MDRQELIKNNISALMNAINSDSYMTLYNANKLIENLGIELQDPDEDSEQTVENSGKSSLIESISAQNLDTILGIQEYEYRKKYKYFMLYSVDTEKMEDLFAKIRGFNDSVVNVMDIDYVSRDFIYPTVKEYEGEIDIKFSYILGKNPHGADATKYPVIVTLFKETKLAIIKYEKIENSLKRDDYDYIRIPNKAKVWIEFNLGVSLNEVNSIPLFRKIRREILDEPEKHLNETEYKIIMDDDLNGRCSFRATDQDKFPFITGVMDLAKQFKDKDDKKLLEDFVREYEKEAMVRQIGVKWKLQDADGKICAIIVAAKEVYFSAMQDKHTIHHVYYMPGVDRERINYVIRYLSRYMEGDN